VVDVRNASAVEAILEHSDTVQSYFMYAMDELREATQGSFLQFIDEFVLEPNKGIEPHFHNSHEFYYVLDGSGTMRVGTERVEIAPRDLVHIGPNEPHTVRAGNEGLRCLAFASSFQVPGEMHTPTTHPG
jgi:mannose-6-phosphate isomerase-like protein (cupin superfamily)